MTDRDIIWLPSGKITAKQIIRSVAEKHGMTVEVLLSESRLKRIAHARQEAMWEIRRRTKLSFPQIAERLGRKDHTTAWHGVRAHERRLAEREAA